MAPSGPRVTVDEVRHVATLARLGLSEQRALELTKDLNTILEHMTVLSRVDTTGVAEATTGEAGMPLRNDRGPPLPLGEPAESFAPEMRDGFFVVPRLSTHDDSPDEGRESSA
jgi:aspartyl-tRNA(Asn)/glutamyl-tRNA(Gln) amidotransferase subunit C